MIAPPSPGQARLITLSTTERVGGYALRYAFDHPTVGLVNGLESGTTIWPWR
jgi:hypothetical protein